MLANLLAWPLVVLPAVGQGFSKPEWPAQLSLRYDQKSHPAVAEPQSFSVAVPKSLVNDDTLGCSGRGKK
jgi:hypothetical protein